MDNSRDELVEARLMWTILAGQPVHFLGHPVHVDVTWPDGPPYACPPVAGHGQKPVGRRQPSDRSRRPAAPHRLQQKGSVMDQPSKFRKKPVVIEATRWEGTAVTATPIVDWVKQGGFRAEYQEPESLGDGLADWKAAHRLAIETLEGIMLAAPGDWIIKGIRGEFYPCKADVFEASYEAVS